MRVRPPALQTGMYSVAGWWKHSDYEVVAFARDREVFAGTTLQYEFSGTLFVDDKGLVVESRSLVRDKKDRAYTVCSNYRNNDKSSLCFIVRRQDPVSEVNLVASYDIKTDCWLGTFEGEEVGEGSVKFALHKLPDTLFVDDIR